MKKLVHGIVEFRKSVYPNYREKFARLAYGQKPNALFVTCSDSRVAPNWFASTDPGDLFVIRNVGNFVPKCDAGGITAPDGSVAAAIEFAILELGISDVIVCGHSDCGAMHALLRGVDKVVSPNLKSWLRHGELALSRISDSPLNSSRVDLLSQNNVLQQVENLMSYPVICEKTAAKALRLHAWWFELPKANVYHYNSELKRFVIIDEAEANRIVSELSSPKIF